MITLEKLNQLEAVLIALRQHGVPDNLVDEAMKWLVEVREDLKKIPQKRE